MARRKDHSKYIMLIAGILLIVFAVIVFAEAKDKEERCESLGGKIVQIFDSETESECDTVWVLKLLSYLGIAVGVALSIIGYLKVS